MIVLGSDGAKMNRWHGKEDRYCPSLVQDLLRLYYDYYTVNINKHIYITIIFVSSFFLILYFFGPAKPEMGPWAYWPCGSIVGPERIIVFKASGPNKRNGRCQAAPGQQCVGLAGAVVVFNHSIV